MQDFDHQRYVYKPEQWSYATSSGTRSILGFWAGLILRILDPVVRAVDQHLEACGAFWGLRFAGNPQNPTFFKEMHKETMIGNHQQVGLLGVRCGLSRLGFLTRVWG